MWVMSPVGFISIEELAGWKPAPPEAGVGGGLEARPTWAGNDRV